LLQYLNSPTHLLASYISHRLVFMRSNNNGLVAMDTFSQDISSTLMSFRRIKFVP